MTWTNNGPTDEEGHDQGHIEHVKMSPAARSAHNIDGAGSNEKYGPKHLFTKGKNAAVVYHHGGSDTVSVKGTSRGSKSYVSDLANHLESKTMKEDIMEETETTEVNNINAAIEALLSGNKLKFKEYMDAELNDRATLAVADVREYMAQTMFGDEEEVAEDEAEVSETTEEDKTDKE